MKRWLFLAAFCLNAFSLSAQVWVGDTTYVKEQRPPRGVFYLDTLEQIGWMRHTWGKPWVEELKSPLEYWDWWYRTAICQSVSTSRRDFERIRWFLINRETFGGRGPYQIGYWGYFVQDSMAIYIARPHRYNRGLLMHEISHALQFINREPVGHTEKWFGRTGCGFSYIQP
jgi:hypothetical protein